MSNEALKRLMEEADVRPYDCYQCGKCTGGCPMAQSMDLKPREVMRCTQTGALGKILDSKSIWLCTGCHTCVERCPHDVDIPAVMESARYMATERGKVKAHSKVFNEIFMMNVRLFGKSHEALLAGLYNVATLSLFQDMEGVPHMMKNKLVEIMPHQVKDPRKINELVKRSKKWRSLR